MNIDSKRRFVSIFLALAAVLIFLLSGCDNDIWNTLESEYLQPEISDTLQNESTVQSKPQSEKSTQPVSSSASTPVESVSQPEESSASVPEESVSQPEEISASVPEESVLQPEESSASAPEESVSQPEESSISTSEESTQSENSTESVPVESVSESAQLRFRSQKLLKQHYEKHGIEMGFASAEEYEKAAAAVVSHPDVLHKIEAEDGDDVYYIESTNEFVVVSTDGYLRTYFNPDRGIDYFNKQ